MTEQRILTGDCREQLARLRDNSIHCCVTSPPYFGLRDYGVAGQLGLETEPSEYVDKIVSVFSEVRRVLRDDGTLWLNLGDSYANDGKWGGHTGGKHAAALHCSPIGRNKRYTGLKPKDLIGIPWRVAFALQAAGWYLRQDIIWAKPNPMPESVRDRCTKSHEYLFLLSKSERYYFDAEAIKEPAAYDPSKTKFPDGWDTGPGGHGTFHRNGREKGKRNAVRTKDTNGDAALRPHSLSKFETVQGGKYATRNKRDVWTLPTSPFPEAHFATFPPALVEPCILAGCPPGGIVLDPFGGAGTTGLVAKRLNRHAVLIELNPAYAEMARRRIDNDHLSPVIKTAQTPDGTSATP